MGENVIYVTSYPMGILRYFVGSNSIRSEYVLIITYMVFIVSTWHKIHVSVAELTSVRTMFKGTVDTDYSSIYSKNEYLVPNINTSFGGLSKRMLDNISAKLRQTSCGGCTTSAGQQVF